MLIINSFDTRDAAKSARAQLVSAQVLVDRVASLALGEPVFPPAEDIYRIIPSGDRFAVALDDPSLPEERDCGD